MEEKQPSLVLGHPDKVEVAFTNSSGNSLLLPKVFPVLVETWTQTLEFRWNSRLGRNWTVSGFNDRFRATFSGWSRDVADNPDWRQNPFAGNAFGNLYLGSRRGTVASVRFTTPDKTDPELYLQNLPLALADMERFGIQEAPSLVEIALDVYGDSSCLQNSVRLSRDKPQDFCHWRGGGFEPGAGSKEGRFTEYSMRNAFLADHKQGRELCCYRRPEFYRVELRLGRKPLSRFLGSRSYERASESSETPLLLRNYQTKSYSPTLDLLGLLPQLAVQHLAFETFDLEKLRKHHPASAYWRLKGASTRQVRFLLARHGLGQDQMGRFTRKVFFPKMRWLFLAFP